MGEKSFELSPIGYTSESYNENFEVERVESTSVSVFDENKKRKNSTNSSSKTIDKTPPTKAEKLHDDWEIVLKSEADYIKTYKPGKKYNYKCDPNISLTFFKGIENVAKDIKCKPEDLAAIMYRESHFDPKAKVGTYTGLIQMDKITFDSIPGKKCSYAQYCKLPREKQLKYAEDYLKMRIDENGLEGKRLSGGQIWTLIHRPSDINKPKVVQEHQKKVDKTKLIPNKIKQEMKNEEAKQKSTQTQKKKLNIKS